VDIPAVLANASDLLGASAAAFFAPLAEQSETIASAWPTGGLGAFLLFLAPVGGGIPIGVIVADRGGVPAWGIAVLYLLSDIVLAFTMEPILALILRLGRRVESVGRVGQAIQRISASAGLKQAGAKSALGLIFVAFAISPTTGRAAAATVGHAFLPGWALAITGDMFYFGLLMASTLWLSSTFADDRLTIVVAVLVAWTLPFVLQRARRRLVAVNA
jgi:hypothetical protein